VRRRVTTVVVRMTVRMASGKRIQNIEIGREPMARKCRPRMRRPAENAILCSLRSPVAIEMMILDPETANVLDRTITDHRPGSSFVGSSFATRDWPKTRYDSCCFGDTFVERKACSETPATKSRRPTFTSQPRGGGATIPSLGPRFCQNL
jgi:hypothetical protein